MASLSLQRSSTKCVHGLFRHSQRGRGWRGVQNGGGQPGLRAAAASVEQGGATTSSSLLSQGDVLETLAARGLVENTTGDEELRSALVAKRLRVYCGFDPTADSLHLGNLLGIVVLRWFQLHGHQPVALLGGATARVGDPSGKSSERPLLETSHIEHNAVAIRHTLSSILAVPSGAEMEEAMVLNNLDWYGPMPLLNFLAGVGRYARVGPMLAKDSVRSRMEGEGMSYTEFTYQLLQGFDFVHLSREHGVRVQVGGSDQWGNILAGTDLLKKISGKEESDGKEEKNQEEEEENQEEEKHHGFTFPLLLKSDGTKFGKSESGAIWLSSAKLSPYKFYQYLLSVPDADVGKLLRMLTFLSIDEVEEVEARMQGEPGVAQRSLAEEVTRFVHGEEGLQQALRATAGLSPGKGEEEDRKEEEEGGEEEEEEEEEESFG